MDPLVSNESTILHQASDRAQRLLDHLVQAAELGAVARPADLSSYPDFPSPGLLAEGEALLQDAGESTRRLLDGLAAASAEQQRAGPPSA